MADKCLLVETITNGWIERGTLTYEEFEKVFGKDPEIPDPKTTNCFVGALAPKYHLYFEVVEKDSEEYRKWQQKPLSEKEY